GDHAQAIVRLRALRGPMEEIRIDRVVHDDRVEQVDAELVVLRAAELGLQDRDVGERVDRRDATVGAVVEATVDAERAVHATHHPAVRAPKTLEAVEVEVERVVEARRGVAGDAVPLDVDAAALKLADQSEQELVPPAVGRDAELMEDGD